MFKFSGPAEVRGFYQRLRDRLQPLLIVLFLALPWVQIAHQPVFLLDFFNRHFIFFGVNFYSHEAPLLFFLVILLVLSIFMVTALFGRLWCGWMCPQTVFLHSLFNKVEKLILGTYSQRYLLFKAQDSFTKKIKILSLYVIFYLLCWGLAHSFAAYFLGAQVVTAYIQDGPSAHLKSFCVLMILSTALFLNFTFFREKLCFFVCPYGRFQNALIDANSLVVFYDNLRGEPRGKAQLQKQNTELGDCIDCNRCVNVCPTKIDIRQGFQMECIACGKCIDACNEVMSKIHRPQHLIRYETGDQKKITFKRFRLLLYAALIVVFLLGFLWALAQRSLVDFNVNRAYQVPFSCRIEQQQKILQNQLSLHLKNQSRDVLHLKLNLDEVSTKKGFQLLTPALEFNLEPEQDIKIPAFIEIKNTELNEAKAEIQIVLSGQQLSIKKNFTFIKESACN